MRNNLLKDLRQDWKQNSRIFFGKNRIMQIGLGRTKAEEVETDLHKVSTDKSGDTSHFSFVFKTFLAQFYHIFVF